VPFSPRSEALNWIEALGRDQGRCGTGGPSFTHYERLQGEKKERESGEGRWRRCCRQPELGQGEGWRLPDATAGIGKLRPRQVALLLQPHSKHLITTFFNGGDADDMPGKTPCFPSSAVAVDAIPALKSVLFEVSYADSAFSELLRNGSETRSAQGVNRRIFKRDTPRPQPAPASWAPARATRRSPSRRGLQQQGARPGEGPPAHRFYWPVIAQHPPWQHGGMRRSPPRGAPLPAGPDAPPPITSGKGTPDQVQYLQTASCRIPHQPTYRSSPRVRPPRARSAAARASLEPAPR